MSERLHIDGILVAANRAIELQAENDKLRAELKRRDIVECSLVACIDALENELRELRGRG